MLPDYLRILFLSLAFFHSLSLRLVANKVKKIKEYIPFPLFYGMRKLKLLLNYENFCLLEVGFGLILPLSNFIGSERESVG